MKIWFDTEFIEDGQTIDLISIGMVREDGCTLYFENTQCDHSRANPWVHANVLPLLTRQPYHQADRAKIAKNILSFIGNNKPEFWAYYADYDWVALCQLYGTMMDLPRGWPMYCRDVKQLCDDLGDPRLPFETHKPHHALHDAHWTREAWQFLMEKKRGQNHPA